MSLPTSCERSPALGKTVVRVDRERVLRFRARAGHLHERLPATSIAAAASGGLQDTAPRAALVALHARVAGAAADSWENPALVQIWFRGADYVVPRADVGVFTLGCLPRDPDRQRDLERLADDVHRVLDGEARHAREVYAELGRELTFLVRAAAVTGRLHIRWDASTIRIIGADRPKIEPEEARLELARRFLRWFAPATRERFRWWAGISKPDAAATWAALEPDLVEVEFAGRTGHVLQENVSALRRARPIEGARLLPSDDPFQKIDVDLLVPDEQLRTQTRPKFVSQAMLLDGEVAGVWHRQARKVRLVPWRRMNEPAREAFEGEAMSLPIPPLSRPMRVRWE
jgi:hypothetical protein